jgi:N,N-dimethylformamidase
MSTDADLLIGYAPKLSFAPGENVLAMISSTASYQTALVELIHGDCNPSGPGFRESEVQDVSFRRLGGCVVQPTFPGSFGIASGQPFGLDAGLTIALCALPTAPARGRQSLVTLVDQERRLSLELSEAGGFRIVGADGGISGSERKPSFTSPELEPPEPGVWASLCFSLDATGAGRLICAWQGCETDVTFELTGEFLAMSPSTILIAAAELIRAPDGSPRGAGTFNGKISQVAILSRTVEGNDIGLLRQTPEGFVGDPALEWLPTMGPGIGSWDLPDASQRARRGELINGPMRACTDHAWNGEMLTHMEDPSSYRAVHFHDDDVSDAGWEPSVEFELPPALRSGVYALRLTADGDVDHIPFVVRPRSGDKGQMAVLLPTFTYLAYGNERDPSSGWSYGDFNPTRDPSESLLESHPEWGLSTYDTHADGSGWSLVALKRPIPNLRPTARYSLVDAPRHLAGDLYLVDWLRARGFEFDVVTDHDLDDEGIELLKGYRAVVTGGHPEYVSYRMLEALGSYVDGGGNLAYLGGNGFYWVTSQDPTGSGLLEVRRGVNGTRQWSSSPGELRHQTTGEVGGLWRYRGTPPNKLVGIGFSAEGWDGANRPYRRTPDSFDDAYSFVFDGVTERDIGAYGLVMNGAAGDELDRADPALGTPQDAVVLAMSYGHSDAYWVCVEDLFFTNGVQGGSADPRVRADMVLRSVKGGGMVFSVGSISWSGSLSHNGYLNGVSRITENVLRHFLGMRPLGSRS